jgi:hypothetical protein
MYRTQLKNKRSDLELSGQHYFEVDILKKKKVKKDQAFELWHGPKVKSRTELMFFNME